MRGHPLRVGVGEAVCHDVEPRFELVVTAAPDLDPGWRDSLVLVLQGKAEHVFKRCEPIASFGQQGADSGVGEVREFHLHGGVAGGEGPLDLVKVGRARHAAEAEPRDLVQWRARFGKARSPGWQGHYQAVTSGKRLRRCAWDCRPSV